MGANVEASQGAQPSIAKIVKEVLVCPRHGDVTSAAIKIPAISEKGGEYQNYFYCINCLNDHLVTLQKNGVLATLEGVVYTESPVESEGGETAPTK